MLIECWLTTGFWSFGPSRLVAAGSVLPCRLVFPGRFGAPGFVSWPAGRGDLGSGEKRAGRQRRTARGGFHGRKTAFATLRGVSRCGLQGNPRRTKSTADLLPCAKSGGHAGCPCARFDTPSAMKLPSPFLCDGAPVAGTRDFSFQRVQRTVSRPGARPGYPNERSNGHGQGDEPFGAGENSRMRPSFTTSIPKQLPHPRRSFRRRLCGWATRTSACPSGDQALKTPAKKSPPSKASLGDRGNWRPAWCPQVLVQPRRTALRSGEPRRKASF